MKEKRYSKEFIEKIKSATSLPDLVHRYTKLNKYNQALCPFHSDKNPSLSVTPRKGLWYCHACNIGGDAIKFIMLAEKIDFPQAVKMLASQAGIGLDGKQ